jgi:DNA-directed RNA polymerase subunit RPC12/RpoP
MNISVPLAINFTHDGVVTQMGNRDPEQCDHAGESWSSELGVRCTQCGVRLFAAPRVLAFKPHAVVEKMYRVWQAAGWPVLDGWLHSYIGDRWILIEHPLFAHIPGILVRKDKLGAFEV